MNSPSKLLFNKQIVNGTLQMPKKEMYVRATTSITFESNPIKTLLVYTTNLERKWNASSLYMR